MCISQKKELPESGLEIVNASLILLSIVFLTGGCQNVNKGEFYWYKPETSVTQANLDWTLILECDYDKELFHYFPPFPNEK